MEASGRGRGRGRDDIVRGRDDDRVVGGYAKGENEEVEANGVGKVVEV